MYRDFKDVREFKEELEELLNSKEQHGASAQGTGRKKEVKERKMSEAKGN